MYGCPVQELRRDRGGHSSNKFDFGIPSPRGDDEDDDDENEDR